MTPELLQRAQQGDHDAFEQIAKAIVGRLFGTASLILRDSDAASDAVQETLISVWKALPSLRDANAFDGWLNRIPADTAPFRGCTRPRSGDGR